MATFKTCVRKQRKDGFWPVYIRVIHQQKVGYIKTDKLVNDQGLGRGNEVTDPFVVKFCSDRIVRYVDMLNKAGNTEMWTLAQVIGLLEHGDEDICFSDYARAHADRMAMDGQMRNARNYVLALQHMERYAGTTKVMFSHLTSTFVDGWIRSMEKTHRAKEMYPVCMRQVFKAAVREFNDYDRDVIRIKTNPWVKVDIPEADATEKLAITPQACRRFFSQPIPESDSKYPSTELGRDVAMMMLCLAGMNTVDLYNLKKVDYYDGVLHYRRAKTRHARKDEAYMEIRVPSLIEPLIEKYAAPDDDEWLFGWHRRLCDSDSFGAKANKGIRKVCELMGMKKEDWYCCYTFRHTWGTIAQNHCGASIADVAFAMNHSSAHKVTRGYLKLDYTPAWELNEKVVELVFFSEEESDEDEKASKKDVFERFSVKQLMRGTVFFRGHKLGEVHDIGFNNVNEIFAALYEFVPKDLPERTRIQIKIENCDKKQSKMYEKVKGVSF